MMGRYAEKTSVGSDRFKAEIERILTRYGAESFMYGWQGATAILAFKMRGRQVKFLLPLPDRSSKEFTRTPTRGTKRTDSAAEAAYEQAVRQRWRALALVIKAKLEAVESGITMFEDEFLAHIVLPNGLTVGDFMCPQIEQAYKTGRMPEMLPMLGGGDEGN